jgi:hypothetical protein
MHKRTALVAVALTMLATALAVAAGAFASAPPTVSAESAGAVTDTAATLSASVNPAGQETTYAFEYGTSSAYSTQTQPQSAGAGSQPVAASTQLAGLQPGTTYHYRVIATNAAGTVEGPDATFKTTGIAPPEPAAAAPATGPVAGVGVEGATLTGTVNTAGLPLGEVVTYYFQLGPSQPYALQSVAQTLRATGGAVAVNALVGGLQSAQSFHYRLVATTEHGKQAAGSDATFFTLPRERLHAQRVEMSASPRYQRALPDRVTVSGRMIPPAGMSPLIACRGYFDITFRVGPVAVQSLRAGIHPDCSFSLPVVFHSRGRLAGGRVTVHVLYAGSRFLERLAAPVETIQVG